MKVGINVMGAEALVGGDVRKVIELVSQADSAGIDMVSISDHLGFTEKSHGERRETHNFPFVLEQPWYEPLSFLSAVASTTKQIRLSTFVLVATLRPTVLLAKQLATLDAISNGRVSIALGVGWQECEFHAAGMSFEHRFDDLEDQIHGMRSLWRDSPAYFVGRNYEFKHFHSYPKPVQGAGLPVLLGFAPTTKNLQRIARVGDGWAVDPAHRKLFAEKRDELVQLFREHGRDPAGLEIHIGQGPLRDARGAIDYGAVKAAATRLTEEGATTVAFRLTDFCSTADEAPEFFREIGRLKI